MNSRSDIQVGTGRIFKPRKTLNCAKMNWAGCMIKAKSLVVCFKEGVGATGRVGVNSVNSCSVTILVHSNMLVWHVIR